MVSGRCRGSAVPSQTAPSKPHHPGPLLPPPPTPLPGRRGRKARKDDKDSRDKKDEKRPARQLQPGSPLPGRRVDGGRRGARGEGPREGGRMGREEMTTMDHAGLLKRTADLALEFLDGLSGTRRMTPRP